MKNKVFLTSLKFNDGTDLSISENDIVIFTGANNCGKNQILRDVLGIFNEGSTPNNIVVRSLMQNRLGDANALSSNFVYKNNKYYCGCVGLSRLDLVGIYWRDASKLGQLARLFVNHLSTENRLADSHTSGQYDTINGTPSNPTQIMYNNDAVAKKVSGLFHEAFNQHLTVNMRGGSTIPLHVGSRLQYDAENDRVSNRYINELLKQPVLERQGDGMRSFASIIMNVLTAEQTISLIDEPEAFLHPPQARLLGKMLVKNKPNNRQLLISTHSEDFLKGVLDCDSQNVKIVRIDRIENINKINVLDNADITTLWSNPLLRYSNILSGLFHRKVVVCESDTDCRFYQAIMNAMYDGTDHTSPDILFTHCGGKDRIKTVVSALRSLKVDVVAVTDIDILNDKKNFSDLTAAFDLNWSSIESHWNNIAAFAKSKSQIPSKNEVKEGIETILASLKGVDFTIEAEKAIKTVMKNTTGWNQIKEVGYTAFRSESLTSYRKIDADCRKAGLFIVPVGEIECFNKAISGHGNKWLNEVLVLNLKEDADLEQARQFVNDIIQQRVI